VVIKTLNFAYFKQFTFRLGRKLIMAEEKESKQEPKEEPKQEPKKEPQQDVAKATPENRDE
jgi:hypothetical protein